MSSQQPSCSSCRQPSCFGQCLQTGSQLVDLSALFIARLDATGEELERIELIIDFVEWILQSGLLGSQQPEPRIGDPPGNYPRPFPEQLEAQGIRGQSIYTVLFQHLDMETFTCKICDHTVMGQLEDAITHQRVAHF